MRLFSQNRAPEHSESTSQVNARRHRRIVFAWLAVAAWGAAIWSLGGDDFSASNTSSTLVDWLRALFAELDAKARYRLIVAIRKSAHFVEYSIFALLAFRAAMLSAGRNQLVSAAWIALFLVLVLASADEARQAFSNVRTGSPYDVAIDLTGGAVTIAALMLFSRRLRIVSDSDTNTGLA